MSADPVLETILQFTDQLTDSWNTVNSSKIDIDFSKILNIVVCGMGGSALGAKIVHSLYSDSIKIPLEVVNGYHIPFYVGEQTLVVISSYSGGTEETINSFHEAHDKKAQIFVSTTGGTLAGLSEDYNTSSYIYDPKFNPSKQPRLALGYSVGSLLALLNKGGFIRVLNEDFQNAAHKAQTYSSEFDPSMDEQNNEAKKLTSALSGKIPILVASEHLFGSVYSFKNQLNETAKTFSNIFDLPELNHHLLEGLKYPKTNKDNLKFVFFESDLYSPRVQKRYQITKDVLNKQAIEHISYKVRSMDKLSQVFEVLTFGSFVQYYLALANNVSMMEIPWVDYFKEEMSKE